LAAKSHRPGYCQACDAFYVPTTLPAQALWRDVGEAKVI
jgi:hypothetical protein